MNHSVLHLKHMLRIGVQPFALQKRIEVIQVESIEQNNRSLVRGNLLRHPPHSHPYADQQRKPSYRKTQTHSIHNHESSNNTLNITPASSYPVLSARHCHAPGSSC